MKQLVYGRRWLLSALILASSPVLAQRAVLTDQSGLIKPTFIAADTGQFGIPVYPGQNQAGGGFVGWGRTETQTPLNFNFVNLGAQTGVLPNASGGMNVSIWSLQSVTHQVQPMLSFYTANGDNWTAIRPVGAGTQLGEIAFFGASTNGMVQTETASLWAVADQDFSDTGPIPVESNTSAGANFVFRQARNGEGRQRITAVLDNRGNLALGSFQAHGNAFPVDGAIVLKDTTNGPAQSVPGAGIFFASGGAPFWRLPNAGGSQPIVLQTNLATPGNLAKFNSFGVIEDSGYNAAQLLAEVQRLNRRIAALESEVRMARFTTPLRASAAFLWRAQGHE